MPVLSKINYQTTKTMLILIFARIDKTSKQIFINTFPDFIKVN